MLKITMKYKNGRLFRQAIIPDQKIQIDSEYYPKEDSDSTTDFWITCKTVDGDFYFVPNSWDGVLEIAYVE